MFNYLNNRYVSASPLTMQSFRGRFEYWLLQTFYKERAREAAELRYLRRRVDTLVHSLKFKERQVEALLKKAIDDCSPEDRLTMVELPDAPIWSKDSDPVFEMSDEEFLRMKA